MAKEKKQMIDCMKIEYIRITSSFFTQKRLSEWRIFIAKCCETVCENIVGKVNPEHQVSYYMSHAMVKETVADAVIGMTKIIEGSPHDVKEPNAFKIAAYLSYWFLRHKPVSILCPASVDLEKVTDVSGSGAVAKGLSWQLRHINEVIAVNIATTFIFNFQKQVCTGIECERIQKKDVDSENNPLFGFSDFEQQRKIMTQKLTYYFAYRTLAPKVIEHILEGYAFHPAWGLTGAHWSTAVEEVIYEG